MHFFLSHDSIKGLKGQKGCCSSYLGLHSCSLVGRVKLDESAVFASASDDGTILENANAEDGTIVDLAEGLCHSIVATAPDKHVTIRVSGQDITRVREGQAGHVLGLVPLMKEPEMERYFPHGSRDLKQYLIEESGLSTKCERGGIELPEVGVAPADGDDDAGLEWVEFGSHDRLARALGLCHLGAAFTSRPVPYGHRMVLGHRDQQVATILSREHLFPTEALDLARN